MPPSASAAAVTSSAGAVGAIVAGACCVSPAIAPLFVSVLGAGGAAWAAGLKPYSPYIMAASLALLMYGFWTVYRRKRMCEQGLCSPSPKYVRVVLWASAGVWVASLVANLVFGLLAS